jgi:membrane protein
MENLKKRAQDLYRWADAHSGGVLGILRATLQGFTEARGAEAAASIAYYALFSLFPLFLALIAAGSFFLQSQTAFNQVLGLVTESIPVSRTLIEKNLQAVIQARGSVGIISLVGLFWSATGVFSTLARNVNRAWPEVERRGFLQGQLVAFAMIGILVIPLVLSLLSTPILSVLPKLAALVGGQASVFETGLWMVISSLVPVVFSYLLFLALYLWVPTIPIKRRAAFWGALVAAGFWEGAKRAFTWYLNSGLVRYELIYGSLGAIVALMLWIYLSALIALLGAHLTSAIDRRQ